MSDVKTAVRFPADREDYLWERIQPTGFCWEWTGSIANTGYGRAHLPGKRYMMAHRAVFTVLVRPLGDAEILDHLCRNHACVNPDHLRVGTFVENVMSGYSGPAVNARKTHCLRGHEYTPENTYNWPGTTHRQCRACQQIHDRNRRAK